MFKTGWNQEWKNVLMQHFQLQNTQFLQKLLPPNCEIDTYNGVAYIATVQMQMTNVSQRTIPNLIMFKSYNELNVRTYVKYNNVPCVLFLSLDVDSIISVLGARIFYSLPYRYRKFKTTKQNFTSFNKNQQTYNVDFFPSDQLENKTDKDFAFWATERYNFVQNKNNYFYFGEIAHVPWDFKTCKTTNNNLDLLKPYPYSTKHPLNLYCASIKVQTLSLNKVKYNQNIFPTPGKEKQDYILYYDKDCYFCNEYTKLKEIKNCINLTLQDGNIDKSYLIYDNSLEFEDGIILINKNTKEIFQGSNALFQLANICQKKSILLTIQKILFKNKTIGKINYKIVLFLRKILKKISN